MLMTIKILYIISVYQIRNIQQECFRLSNLFSCCVWGRGSSTRHCITIIYNSKINPGVTFSPLSREYTEFTFIYQSSKIMWLRKYNRTCGLTTRCLAPSFIVVFIWMYRERPRSNSYNGSFSIITIRIWILLAVFIWLHAFRIISISCK